MTMQARTASQRESLADQISSRTNELVSKFHDPSPERAILAGQLAALVDDFSQNCAPTKDEAEHLEGVWVIIKAVLEQDEPPSGDDPPDEPHDPSPGPHQSHVETVVNVEIFEEGLFEEEEMVLAGACESDLWEIYARSRSIDVRNKLVERYVTFVYKIAQTISRRLNWEIQDDDLSSFGMVGLIEAVERFPVYATVEFETYSISRIRGAIFDGLRQIDWLPRRRRWLLNAVREVCSQHELVEGISPDNTTLREMLAPFGVNSTN